jgi:hypothetical protein
MAATVAANVSWFTVVASSALTSAIVNVGWNALSKWLDRRRENKKEVQRVDHVKLEIVQQLEAFAKRCRIHSNNIHDGLHSYYEEHDDSFSRVGKIQFEFDPAPKWEELPVSFVAPIKWMPLQFRESDQYIMDAVDYIGIDDAYELELERVAFYGLKALNTAAKIRGEIKADYEGGAELDVARKDFEDLIEKRRQLYLSASSSVRLLPEFTAQFEAEWGRRKPAD